MGGLVKGLATKKIICSSSKKGFPKNVATKLEGGEGGMAFVAGPLKKELFCCLPYY